MYKEFRDLTMGGAMHQLECEMTGTHRAQTSTIQILGAKQIGSRDLLKRERVLEYAKKGIKYPIVAKTPLRLKKYRSTFLAKRPFLLRPVEH